MENARLIVEGTLLRREGGLPFFWLADTVWELFHRYTPADADRYLKTRADQHFTVIQAVLLAEEDGLRVPDRLGNLPFENLESLHPNEAYWQNVDRVVRYANSLGLVMALVATWGDKVSTEWGIGPKIFNPENARLYGRWVGARYRHDDVVWIIGGDRNIKKPEDLDIWRAMACGIRESVGDTKLLTFHPGGAQSSATFVHDEPWLDFNMLQSGHCGRDNANWSLITRDLGLWPRKPVLDGEPNYEDHPVMASFDGLYVRSGDYFGAFDIRKAFYRSVLSGACGFTYGCHSVWQGWDAATFAPINEPLHPSMESLEIEGARQMTFGRTLAEWLLARGGVQANDGLLLDYSFPPNRHPVACSFDGGVAVYTPVRQIVRLRSHVLGREADTLKAFWFNPINGILAPAEKQDQTPSTIDYLSPESGDRVLILCEPGLEASLVNG